MERPGTMKVKCLAQEHNVMTPARAQNQIIMLDLKFLPRGRGGGVLPVMDYILGGSFMRLEHLDQGTDSVHKGM